MAQNLMGQVTTAKRSDTVSEHLTASSLTGNLRFRTMVTAQKLTDLGSAKWQGLRSTLGIYGLVLRTKLTKMLKS